MRLTKSILSGVAVLGLAAGTAIASEPSFMSSEAEPLVVYEDATPITAVYGIDDDMDGRVDRTLILEQSDSLG